MAELEIHTETAHEKDPMGQKVGIMASILAVLLAVVTISSHRTHTAAIMHKSEANDAWAHYQSTRVKFHSVELGENLIRVFGKNNEAADKMLADYGNQKTKYQADSSKIEAEATENGKAAAADEERALRYDIGEGLLEIGLVLSSLYFVSRKKLFPVIGAIAGVAGTAIAITGLMV
jgi:hypothetical protein